MHEITVEYLYSQGLSPSFVSRFFSHIHYTESCWFWTGSRRRKGMQYGHAFRGMTINRSGTILVHKASWILHFGPVPEGMYVCHDCPDGDCPYCVNPAHLWLGDRDSNFEDMREKRRHLHTFTDDQIQEIRSAYEPYRMSFAMLAKQYGVSAPAIRYIVRGRYYRGIGGASDLPKFPHKLTPEQENEVRALYDTGQSQRELARRFQVSPPTIVAIVQRTHS